MTFTAEPTAKALLEYLTGYPASAPAVLGYVAKACFLALLTSTPATEGTRGVTMAKIAAAEVKTATTSGYTRFQFENAAGKKLKISETGASTVGNCTMENEEESTVETGLGGAESKVTYWAVLGGAAKGTPGNEEGYCFAWGTCTSTGIGPTQTPVKIAIGKLKVELI